MGENQSYKQRGILFFDTSKAGDVVQYIVALIRNPVLPADRFFSFAVSQWVAQQACREAGSDIPSNVKFIILPEPLVRKKRKFRDVWGSIKCILLAEKIAEKHGCSHIYFMQLDNYMAGLFLRLCFPCKNVFSGLFYRPLAHYCTIFGTKLSFKEKILSFLKVMITRKFLSSPHIKLLFCFDWYFVKYSNSLMISKKIFYVPDFAVPSTYSTRPRQVPEEWIKSENRFLLFGHLTKRKGVLTLLESIKRIDSDTLSKCSFFLCGRIDQGIKKSLRTIISALNASNKLKYVKIVDEFISDEGLWWLINKCHLILIPYQRHPGSSGVLSWAATAGKPVLAESFGLVGHEVKKWGLGFAVNTNSPEEIASAIIRFINNGFAEHLDKKKQAEYAAIHNETSFSKVIINALCYDREYK